ncbi:MAG: enoyl-CoA hydratase/isomerase family protein [Gammaproteobacteria bacterium]|nr:enoyl-CoA hydratase/isomerase family protein [Gammaproteobacteria bacterium]
MVHLIGLPASGRLADQPMPHQPRETVLYEVDGPLATVTLNRPESLNGITNRMMRELYETLNEVASDRDVRAVLFTGAGRAFCPGADLKAYTSDERQEPNRPEYFHITSLLHEMPRVTIAAVNGACAGAGFGWACACDLRYASERAMFNSAFLGVGISGDMAGPWLLPRIVGATRAREIFFTSQKFGAAEALEMGLVLATFPGRDVQGRRPSHRRAHLEVRAACHRRDEEELRRGGEPVPARLHRTRDRTPQPHRRERGHARSVPGVRRETRAAFRRPLIHLHLKTNGETTHGHFPLRRHGRHVPTDSGRHRERAREGPGALRSERHFP